MRVEDWSEVEYNIAFPPPSLSLSVPQATGKAKDPPTLRRESANLLSHLLVPTESFVHSTTIQYRVESRQKDAFCSARPNDRVMLPFLR